MKAISDALIPVHELGEFARLLDDEGKREVLTLARVMREAQTSKHKTRTLRAWAGRLQTSYSTLRRLYYGETVKRHGVAQHRDGWMQSGWRALVNMAKYCPVTREIPVSFVDYWKELRGQYNRDQTGRAAHDTLLENLRQWERDPRREERRIPGYDLPPKRDAYTGLPPGWTYENLMKHKLAGLERAALQQGRNAALLFRAPMISTRVGLKVGQILQFDDQEYDNFINFLGINRHLQRTLGLDCIDVATASQPAHAFLPIIYNPEEKKREKLKAYHADWFLAHVLITVGYRQDTGTVCIDEHGTMSGGDAFWEAVARATGDKVTNQRSGIIDNKASPAMFDGKGGGNFKFKALIEGARVAHRNRMSALPAPTGLDPDHAPEEAYYGLQRVNNRILKLMEKLNPERAMQLAHVAMDYHTFVRCALEVYDVLEDYDEHELEGWMEMNWVVTEWRHSLDAQDWHSMEELNAIDDPTICAAMKALVVSRPGLLKTRRLSRRAAFERHRHELTQVRGAAIPIMLGREAARVGTVRNDTLIEVQDQEFFPDGIYFRAELKQGRRMLDRGEKYLVFVDPFGARHAEVCDLDGRWLGTVQLWDRPNPLDVAAKGRQFGIADAAFNRELQANVPRWSLPTTEARTRIFEHNTRVAQDDTAARQDRATGRHEKSAREFGAVLRQSSPEAVPVGAGSEDAEVWPDAQLSPQDPPQPPHPTSDHEVW